MFINENSSLWRYAAIITEETYLLSGLPSPTQKYRHMSPRSVTILLAEDDCNNHELFRGALDESGIENQLYIVENGADILDFLKNRGKYTIKAKFPRPGLILLDLNMLLMGGREALVHIKNDPDLNKIPIIVLTPSTVEEVNHETYKLGITGFIPKPMSCDGLVKILKSLGNYLSTSEVLPAN